MIQCCVCEDWFHSRVSTIWYQYHNIHCSIQHLGGGEVPEEYEEMVCDGCMASHDFLKPYKLCPPVRVGRGEKEEVVDVTNSEEGPSEVKDTAPDLNQGPMAVCSTESEVHTASETTAEDGGSSDGGREVKTDQVCELARRRKLSLGVAGSEDGAGYFSATWRTQLCNCPQCMVSWGQFLLPLFLSSLSSHCTPRTTVSFSWISLTQ